MRVINEIRKETNDEYPRVVVWENVVGALNSNAGADFGRVIDSMAEAGSLVVEWRVLDAQYFGVPQRRRRVFVVAVFDPSAAEGCPDPILSVGEGLFRDSSSGGSAEQAVAAASSSGVASRSEPRAVNYAVPTGRSILGSEIVSGLNATDYKWVQNSQVDENKLVVIDRAAFNQGRNALFDISIAESESVPALVARGPHAVGQPFAFDSAFDSQADIFVDVSPPVKGSQSAPAIATGDSYSLRDREGKAGGGKGLLVTHEKALTLNAHGDQRVFVDGSPMILRRLTPIECERLMGWSDDWTLFGSDGERIPDTVRYRMIGNGVASPVARWIAERIAPLL
jgi:DNA (cytosine-5)-methyltransferase 1